MDTERSLLVTEMPQWRSTLVQTCLRIHRLTRLPTMVALIAITQTGTAGAEQPAEAAAREQTTTFIQEYRVTGATRLPVIEIEAAVYPYLGPDRTPEDVERARASLEKAYRDKGYQTVSVLIPPQEVRDGIVTMQVVETTVGRLRVKGARYVSPAQIKAQATSVAEGTVIDFNEVPKNLIALNQVPDRQISPSLRAGTTPGTVDVDLEVKDNSPVHGSLELNNRSGPDTTRLRLNGALSDNNVFQLGHTAGLNFQVSPQDMKEVKVISGYYLARFQDQDLPGLMFQASKQDSEVSTIGNVAVKGRNTTAGLRAIFSLPSDLEFYQTASLGLDYKHTFQQVKLGGGEDTTETPSTYYPFQASYSASWTGKKSKTELNAEVDFHMRGMGSAAVQFDANRYNSDGSFVYFRGDLSRTQELPLGLQAFGKVQGQIANQPLLSLEQFTGGGLGTVRGYLEGEVSGDDGVAGTIELRSPNLFDSAGRKDSGDWRVYAFGDFGYLTVIDALASQHDHYYLAGCGLGMRIKFLDHFNGSADAAFPFYKQSKTKAHDTRITFRAGLEF